MTHAAVYTVNLAVIEKATEIANADSKANGNLANLPYKIVHEGKNWLIAAFEDETFFDRNELYGFQVGNNSLVVYQDDVCDCDPPQLEQIGMKLICRICNHE